MQKTILTAFILLTVIGGCKPKPTDTIPKQMLAMDKIASIIADIHLAEATVTKQNLKPDTAKLLYVHYQKQIFKYYGVDSATYFNSFDYYSGQPWLFEPVYARVVDTLVKRNVNGWHSFK